MNHDRLSKLQAGRDQNDDCLTVLTEGDSECLKSVEYLKDEGLSGELRHRPGIDLVRGRILQEEMDLIVCEDSSRLFRHGGMCDELVSMAVDTGIRVICINDRVDTLMEDWPQRLWDAQRHHSQDNYYTRFRIKRAHEGLWKMGAAIGPRLPGYRRVIRNSDLKKPPKFDELDEEWIPIVLEAFKRVARKEPPWQVAESLTNAGLPKSSNAQIPEWTIANVIALIRNPIYRGFERFRVTIFDKKYMTGKSRQKLNPDSEKILQREMPHLRVVEDWLWQAANGAIDSRRRKAESKRGEDHPLAGIPRDSRSPLSNLFFCAICGAKLHMEGRNEGGYRCSGACRRQCWNKVTALRDFTHLKIGSTVSQTILDEMQNVMDPLLAHLETVFPQDEDFERQEQDLKHRRQDLQLRQQRLLRILKKQDADA